MSDREPEFEESRNGTERATKVVEEQGGLPEDNPFTEVVVKLRQDGESWRDIYDTFNEVFEILDAAALEEGWELVPEWRVAVLEHDPDTPSGKRFDYYERTAETAEKAESMVKRHTGCPVAEEKTEQIGVAKVS